MGILRNLASVSSLIIIMLLIYTPAVTNRLTYIFDLLLGELLGVTYRFTTSGEEYLTEQGAKICYSDSDPGSGIFIKSTGILFEDTIHYQHLELADYKGSPVFFATAGAGSLLPFDPFAAAFYLVTRYEEYTSLKTDHFDRFEASESIAWKGKFLREPVVNRWALRVKELLLHHYPNLVFWSPSYRFLPTIDIDHAYAYKCRKAWRILGSYGRSALKGNWHDVILRTQVLTGRKQDPYDTYGWLENIHRQYQLQSLYFVLFADYGGEDNNVTVKNKGFHRLLLELDRHSTVGIHPSLSSGHHHSKLHAETRHLAKVLGRDIKISRQHFLKVKFPYTYASLAHMGIRDDYSMGYASVPGFRAGIAHPFYFFDLVSGQVTSLRIHPISVMDVTLLDYCHYTPEKAIEEILRIIGTVKSAGGEFIPVWHNESLSDEGRWKGWRRVYEEMVKAAL
jgi:hypothetical protein